ncbi:glycine--tRNA ligase subunit beta [Exiguobacterium antarcticum]|uniref:Glycine--tRNA ligase beta subunit n=1 Tax=Exiguobacterium antarcticum TaxID=132920 RepID=A0ABT6QZF6_9BACL|nr:glycine--tRNA ligase subunit beta [Exiguobacterium antarcticum]AFS69945.1 Glycyl-tRNA synthetase beta subunit [Exiguobacterium antarcticum B7]MDI3234067.1 glycine--tRNA ligase subunit beta [Exiguobacterium antarcticum]
MHELLLEIGLEEMPARFVLQSETQLKDRITTFLKEARITFETIESFSTPRRLAVLVTGMSERQTDLEETLKGPAKRIAQDEEGNWTKAAQGFARGKGLTTEDLFLKEEKGVEYIFATRKEVGQETATLMPGLKQIVEAMSFPKNMRWSTQSLRYMRPIRWMIALLDEQVIPFEVATVETGRTSRGHRFLGQDITILRPNAYVEALAAEHVIVSYDKRRQMIEKQIQTLSEQEGFDVPIDPTLLEEVTNLVEYPTALFGAFDEAYLELPEEVLITTMKEHQRYFPVKKDGTLLHYFVTVRNGNANHLENVARGNEKVIRARLADAQFFYEEDKKADIDAQAARLDKIVFHEKLGTTGEKVRRVREMALQLADRFGAEQAKVERAGTIYKFDLVSQMVYEFTELQGMMGERYANMKGEDAEVAASIREHYLPRFAGDESPSTATGTVLAVLDKMDSVAGFFGVGMIPSGSADPYALRRQAQGIVQILSDRQIDLTLSELIDFVVAAQLKAGLYQADAEQVKAAMEDFFNQRLKFRLSEKGHRHDVIEAALEPQLTVEANEKRAAMLEQATQRPTFKKTVEQLSRVLNISKKAEAVVTVDPILFENDAERALHEQIEQLIPEIEAAVEVSDYERAIQVLEASVPTITAYFDGTMIMADDEAVRTNRLSEMKRFATAIEKVARFNALTLV